MKKTIKRLEREISVKLGIDILKNINKARGRRIEKNGYDEFVELNNDPLKRVGVLENNSSKKKIVFLYEKSRSLPSTFRYRGYNMSQILNHSDEINSTYLFIDEDYEYEYLMSNIKNIQAISIIRLPYTFRLKKILEIAKQNNIKIIFDLDDLIFRIHEIDDFLSHVGAQESNFQKWLNLIPSVYQSVIHADVFTTTNKFLKKEIQKEFDKECFVITNMLNDGQVEESNQLISIPRDIGNNMFKIGFFSGTDSHNENFRLIQEDILNVLETNKDIELHVVGFLDLDQRFDRFKNRIKKSGFMNYIEMLKYLRKIDLLLVPLVINDYSNSKSELKYFESGLVETPGIFSPTFIYNNIIEDKVNGMIAQPGEWGAKILEMKHNKKLYNLIGNNIRPSVLRNYYGDEFNMNVLDIYKDILKPPLLLVS